MKEKLYITFHSEDDIIQFVDICCKYDDAIDVKANKLSTDGKSILGMLMVEKEKQLEIEYGCFDDNNSYEEFRAEVLEKCDIKVVPN